MPTATRALTVSSPSLSTSPSLSRGMSGPEVRELQRLLEARGFSPQGLDGAFGPLTQSAVRSFQTARGLPATGAVNAQTWAALRGGGTGSTPALSSNPTLRQGDLGGDVRRLQEALQARGFSPGSIDSNFGPATRAAVVRFQRARGLEADGVVGSATWAALSQGGATPAPNAPGSPTSSATRQRILDVARAQLGTLESGTNAGDSLRYQRYFGRGPEKWCADFTSWVMQQSGLRMNNPYTPSIVNQLRASGNWKGRTNPQPGDLVLFDWDRDGGADHIGIVESVNRDGSINTIEGNTTDPNNGNREGVFRRTRAMSTVLGFGNPY